MAETPRAIIYDLDGTILDSVHKGFKRFFDIAQELKLRSVDAVLRQLVWEKWGGSTDGVIRLCWPDADVDRFIRRWVELDLLDPPPLVAGVRNVLSQVREFGIAQAILTNRGDSTYPLIRFHRIRDFFAVVSSGKQTGFKKPHPKSADEVMDALQKLGITDRRSMLFVGDTIIDLEFTRAAGIPFVAVLSGNTPEEKFVREGLDLAHILLSIAHLPHYLNFEP